MAWDQVVPGDHESQTCGADVFLRTSVDDAILGPVDRLCAKVA